MPCLEEIWLCNLPTVMGAGAGCCGKYLHYENTPMQYTAIFHGYKNVHLQKKYFNMFSYFCSKH